MAISTPTVKKKPEINWEKWHPINFVGGAWDGKEGIWPRHRVEAKLRIPNSIVTEYVDGERCHRITFDIYELTYAYRKMGEVSVKSLVYVYEKMLIPVEDMTTEVTDEGTE